MWWEIVERRLGKESIIEIGCGKGSFLEMLVASGFDVTGFDPTYEGNNPRVVKEYFAAGVDLKAEGLVLRHVLEHVPDPVSFLSSLREANRGHGRIYIEVPCFDWILRKRAWFDVFFEHVNYFRLTDFERMFEVIHEKGRLFGGQYQYVVAELSSLRSPKFELHDRVHFPADFLRTIEFESNRSTDVPSVVWGGSSKGVIFSLFRERWGRPVTAVVDINPAKQGRFLPVTGLEVKSPGDGLRSMQPNAIIYVMNSNYLEEIKGMSGRVFEYACVDGDESTEAR